MDDFIFEARSPLGYFATLRRRTWAEHEARRPELAGQLPNVELTIREPHIVIGSEGGLTHYYRMGHGSGKTANCYLHVLVRQRGTRYVIASAWFTPELEEGEVLWFRTQ